MPNTNTPNRTDNSGADVSSSPAGPREAQPLNSWGDPGGPGLMRAYGDVCPHCGSRNSVVVRSHEDVWKCRSCDQTFTPAFHGHPDRVGVRNLQPINPDGQDLDPDTLNAYCRDLENQVRNLQQNYNELGKVVAPIREHEEKLKQKVKALEEEKASVTRMAHIFDDQLTDARGQLGRALTACAELRRKVVRGKVRVFALALFYPVSWAALWIAAPEEVTQFFQSLLP